MKYTKGKTPNGYPLVVVLDDNDDDKHVATFYCYPTDEPTIEVFTPLYASELKEIVGRAEQLKADNWLEANRLATNRGRA
jgi:hypothetical protein